MNAGLAATPRHCRQCFKSTVVALGAEPLKGRSPRTSIARVRLGESQVYGPSLSPADVLDEQDGVLPTAGRPECMKSPPFLRSHRTRARNGKIWGVAGSPSVPTCTACAASLLLPAHRRLPHQAFLSGLWWKLLSLQPLRSCLLASA